MAHGTRTCRGAAQVAAVCVAATAAIALALLGLSPTTTERPAAKVAPIFSDVKPAANPSGLVLSTDGRKVLGWISGDADFAGREVKVRHNGRTETVIVQRDNTFTWYYKVEKPSDASFTVGKWTRSARLKPPATLEPSVFFVVDRTAYRPGQPVQFVGFLRKPGSGGRFEPIAGREVEVEIRSAKKKTVAAKLKLKSDDLGRIVGSYSFNREDALDEYALSIPGYRGKATVKLAEFRKAKVKLDITGTVEGRRLKLTFKAVDFLGKPVPSQRVQFTAMVIRRAAKRGDLALKAGEFVYHNPALTWLPGAEQLTDEQLLLLAADGNAMSALWLAQGPAVLAQTTGEIKLDGKSEGVHVIDLKDEWVREGLAVSVQGVLVDQNGREQRAAKQIDLTTAAAAGKVTVALQKRSYFVDEPIALSVHAPKGGHLTVVAMKLAVSYQQPVYYPQYRFNNIRSSRPAYQSNLALSGRRGYPRWQPYYIPRNVQETLVTAAPIVNGVATLKLSEPGAYRLVAIGTLAGGTKVRERVGCVVRQKAGGLSLVLKLDKREYRGGEKLTGTLHSRFKGAKVLLTLRDSTGLRLWGTVRTTGAVTRISERLPTGLAYGCSVTAHYVDKAGRTHVAQRNVRVEPIDRMLEIHTEMKKIVNPGEQMRIRFKVNRNQPVDLVVSVYDESLLGIAPDRSADIRNFYLADERVFRQAGMSLLTQRLGGVTVEELLPKVKELVKANPNTLERTALQNVLNGYTSGYLYDRDMAALMSFIGIRARLLSRATVWHCQLAKGKGAENRLADLIGKDRGNYRLAARVYDELTVLAVVDRRNGQMVGGYNPAYYGGLMVQNPYAMRRSFARGDAHYSLYASGNASVSGQAFISHMPPAMPDAPAMPDLDTGDGAIMIRRDFSDLAYWNAMVRTDDTGQAEIDFKLPDSLTNWRVVVTAVTADMHVGQATDRFRTYKPIMVWPMIPQSFTQGDKICVFARVHNRTDKSQKIAVSLAVRNGRVIDRKTETVNVGPKASETVYWTFAPGQPGYTELLMTAKCDAGADASLKRLPVVPACNVESSIASAGFCKDDGVIEIPKDVDLATARLEVTVSPSLLSDMVDTLDYLVQYPHGCVEQTMSRFLPAIKVAGILKTSGIRHKGLEGRLPKCVAGGIKRLIQLQHADGGWGWNGKSATHEMMTPYALFGLMEAEKAGYSLGNDQAVNKGLARLKRFIDQMGSKQAADRIYCMYVYAQRHKLKADWWKFIDVELDGRKLSDYAMALALELAVREKKTSLAKRLAGELRAKAQKSGSGVYWRTAGFSRWGNDPYEITAAVMKALVAYDANDKLLPKALSYFARTKRGNRWNSTKATAMVLFAMCDYLAAHGCRAGEAATIRLALNGVRRDEMTFSDGLAKKTVIPGKELKRGRNVVRFEKTGAGMMYRLVLRYRPAGPDVPASATGINVSRCFYLLDRSGKRIRQIKPGDAVGRGSYIESYVSATPADRKNMRYCLVTNSKPSGSEIVPTTDKRFQQGSTHYVLREDTASGVLYHHENAGRGLTNRCVLHAELAGEFIVPPAAVELMYRTEVHGHSGTFRFKVVDKEEG